MTVLIYFVTVPIIKTEKWSLTDFVCVHLMMLVAIVLLFLMSPCVSIVSAYLLSF